ncbi:MAG: glutamine synthetase III [bacterium]|nr:glutamine synthetase III [bacterium]
MSIRQDVLEKISGVKLSVEKLPKRVSNYFGENTFSISVIKKHISKKTFASFRRWLDEGKTISMKEADEIANAMKDWAIGKGATYYTHWFQPMTGLTAEKHDSFISLDEEGRAIEKFSGSMLIQGEPDASSFPSGGIRTTFEARGYTAWDPSSPAFVIECELGKTLCIPSIFISYHGEALDKKLPLLRSDEAINKATVGLLKLFGHKDVKRVFSDCGAEQEYFLIDKRFYRMRQDLLMTERTLIGASSPKGQQLEDQYFGSIKERVINYMNDVSIEAYKLGIPLKTRHNEVAPHQFEFAPVFEDSNIAADHNQLLMDIIKKIALKHDMVCLLHEKPFAGINGSGKHINWSLSDDKRNNLFNHGNTPEDNLQFLVLLIAVIRAVYKHADLLYASIASAGNEHRLGANEAPPAVISVFVGDQLTKILGTIEKGKKAEFSKQDIVNLGVGKLPTFNKDVVDRNRTSPFAFTGNKFEFRAVGSSQNISTPIMVINTIVTESIDYITDRIKKESNYKNFSLKVLYVLGEIIRETKSIRFEGDNYSKSWIKEAGKRGLVNEPSTPKALKALIKEENIALFEKYGVLTRGELVSRYNIWMDMYCKKLEIEANTLREMVDSNVVPAGFDYQGLLAKNLTDLVFLRKNAGLKIKEEVFEDLKNHLTNVTDKIYYVRKHTRRMEGLLKKAGNLKAEEKSNLFFEELKPLMEHIRKHVDELECVVADEHWDLPKYREMLFVQ